MIKYAFCLHTHFYLPPRANPMNGILGSERSAAPFRNWNDRLYEEVYRPNASLGNFELFNFDIGNAILLWLDLYADDTHQVIIDSVKKVQQRRNASNMLGIPLHQSPLPLLSRRDRLTQLIWGKEALKSRFGVEPLGVFLPEFAADIPTLQSVVDAGYEFTVLRSSQVNGLPANGGAGPYQIRLSKGDSIQVFVIDDALSASLIQEMTERGGSAYWVRQELAGHLRSSGPLTLVYTDGNALGQNHMKEADFVHYLLKTEIRSAGCHLVTLEEYHKQGHQPLAELELIPYERKETEQQAHWRDALHDLMTECNLLFAEIVGDNAWKIRNQAFSVENTEHIELIRSQMALQRAWANVAALETPYITDSHIIREAAYAILQIKLVNGTDFSTILTDRMTPKQISEFTEILHTMMQDARATGTYPVVDAPV